MHYNLFSNHREALKFAMQIGNTFQVGGVQQHIGKQDLDILTKALYEKEVKLPSKDDNNHGKVSSKEMATMIEIIDSTSKDAVNSNSIIAPRKFYPTRDIKNKKVEEEEEELYGCLYVANIIYLHARKIYLYGRKLFIC